MRLALCGLAPLLVFALAACGQEGAAFAIPPDQVQEQLLTVKPPAAMFGGVSKNIASRVGDNGSVVWTISEGFRPELRFTANIVPVDDGGSRIAIDVEGASSDPADPRNTQLAQNPDLKELYRGMMAELVAAELEGRTPDLARYHAQLVTMTKAYFAEANASVDRAAQASYEMERHEEENRRRAEDAAWEREIEAQWKN